MSWSERVRDPVFGACRGGPRAGDVRADHVVEAAVRGELSSRRRARKRHARSRSHVPPTTRCGTGIVSDYAPSVTHRVHEWFQEVSRAIQEDWERFNAAARDDPQKAGHSVEAIWADVLRKWLPGSYEVETRKYILLETDDAPEPRETDIVVFGPGYPEGFRARAEVRAGGVAAALYARRTLDAEGIRDATARAVEIRRHLKPRYGSVRGELLGPFPVGLVAHSHGWKRAGSTPADNVTRAAATRDAELARHPRECLDLICVADLTTWTTVRVPWIDTPDGERCHVTRIEAHPEVSPAPVASFVTHLLRRLSYADPSLRPMTEGLFALEMLAIGGGHPRQWELDKVFSEEVRGQLRARLGGSDVDWLRVYL